MNKILASMLLTTIILALIALDTSAPITVQATAVNGILFTDTTWTKANSPYALTGPTAVNHGVTLTIEPGVIVNLNGFYLQINGTLNARGTSAERIRINGQDSFGENWNCIKFTPLSTNWSSQSNSGSIIENADVNWTEITITNTSPKISKSNVSALIVIHGGSPEISGNILSRILDDGNGGNGSPIISDNSLGDIQLPTESCSVSGNTAYEINVGGSSTIVNNAIHGGKVSAGASSLISNNTITDEYVTIPALHTAVNAGAGSIISNNNITGNIVGSPSVITGNTVKGGGAYTYDWGRQTAAVYAVDITGNTTLISNNTIAGDADAVLSGGGQYSYQILAIHTPGGDSVFSNNRIIGEVDGTFSLISNNFVNGTLNAYGYGVLPLFKNNIVMGSVYGDSWTIVNNTINGEVSGSMLEIVNNTIKGDLELRGNTFMHNNVISSLYRTQYGYYHGISVQSGTPTIERNLLANDTDINFYAGTSGIIRNNTFVNDTYCIGGATPSTTIIYNNFENYSTTISLYDALGANATYNWWGTTNQTAIRESFHDYYDDFNLGNVTFTPLLATPNPQAMPEFLTTNPPVIPETFPTWIILTLLLIISLASAIVFKQKTKTKTN